MARFVVASVLAPPDAGHDDNFIVQGAPHHIFCGAAPITLPVSSVYAYEIHEKSFIVLNPNMQPLVMHSYMASFGVLCH